jgi:beta-lactamase regulating signal transducer with metallopeptidase domain
MLLLQNLYPFLQTIGFALANNLWQAFLIWIMYEFVASLKISSAIKYVLAVTAQLAIFSMFMFSIQHFYSICIPAYQYNIPLPNNFSITASSEIINTIIVAVSKTFAIILPYIAVVYLIALPVLITRWIFQYCVTQQYHHQPSSLSNSEWNEFIYTVSDQLNIHRKIKIFISNKVTGPVTIGFLKPIILIPLATINHLSKEQMEAVLLHEIAHIKRYDYFINLFLTVIETVLFFNPFSHIFKKKIQKERENSCDDWVLAYSYAPVDYANALLQLAHLSNAKASSLLMNASKNDGLLLNRIKRLLGLKEINQTKIIPVLILLMITFVIALPLLVGTVSSQQKHIVSFTKNTTAAYKLYTVQNKAGTGKVTILRSKTSNEKTVSGQNNPVEKSEIIVDETVDALKELSALQMQKTKIGNNDFAESAAAISLSDEDLKQKLKDYTQLKKISISDIKAKVDSINVIERKNIKTGLQLLSSNGQIKTSTLFTPAVYYYKNDSLKVLDSLHKKTLITNYSTEKEQDHLFIIINQQNEKGEPVQLIIEINNKKAE